MGSRYAAAGTHRSTGTGWNGFRAPIHIDTSFTLGLLQVRHCAWALLLLQLGQDGGLTLREGWHFLQDSCLLEGLEVGVAILTSGTSPVAQHQTAQPGARTRMSVLATVLSRRYSTARCCSSTSAFFSWLSLRSTS